MSKFRLLSHELSDYFLIVKKLDRRIVDLLQKSYIQNVLGIQQLWLCEDLPNPIPEKRIVGLPAISVPQFIFLLLDSQDQDWSEQHELVFQNILRAMKLNPQNIWKSPVSEITILDFLTHLRHREWNSHVIVMSRNPLISESISRLGPHLWVEVFSISEMIKRPEVKRVSWQLLQEIMKNL
jgi:hypothetical protein